MRIVYSMLRIAVITLTIGGALVFAGFASYRFLLQSQISVAAPAGSIVRAINLQNGSKVTQMTVSSTSATVALDNGNYQIIVTNNGIGQSFYVQTTWLKRVSLQFAPPKQLTPTQLAHQTAYNAIGDAEHAIYLDTSRQAIEQLNIGVAAVLNNDGATGVQAMKVISGNRAIVVAGNSLYVLHDSRMNPLRTDGFPDNVSTLVVGTNPCQESFAVLVNNTLYWYQSASAAPRQITKLDKQADQLAVGGDQVIAYSTRMPDAKQDIRYAYTSTYAVDPLLISVTSGNQKTIAHGPVIDASISPDGQYATIEQRGAAHTDIMRLTDGVTVQRVENAGTLTPVWTSNTQYVYGRGSSMWMFNVSTLSANTVATLPSNQTITSVTYNSDAQQYLATTYPNEQEAAIYQLQ